MVIFFWRSEKAIQVCFEWKFIIKELSLCHKFCFSKSYIFGFQCRRIQIFQAMNSFRSNSLSFRRKRFTPSGCTDIGIRKCGRFNSFKNTENQTEGEGKFMRHHWCDLLTFQLDSYSFDLFCYRRYNLQKRNSKHLFLLFVTLQ